MHKWLSPSIARDVWAPVLELLYQDIMHPGTRHTSAKFLDNHHVVVVFQEHEANSQAFVDVGCLVQDCQRDHHSQLQNETDLLMATASEIA